MLLLGEGELDGAAPARVALDGSTIAPELFGALELGGQLVSVAVWTLDGTDEVAHLTLDLGAAQGALVVLN